VQALRTGDEAMAVTTTRAYYERVDQKLMALLYALAGVSAPGARPEPPEPLDSEPPEGPEAPRVAHPES